MRKIIKKRYFRDRRNTYYNFFIHKTYLTGLGISVAEGVATEGGLRG